LAKSVNLLLISSMFCADILMRLGPFPLIHNNSSLFTTPMQA
jgi:hypothetical protein